jgi:enoyl-CoA hydratase
VPGENLMAAAKEIAQKIAAKSKATVRLAKDVINKGMQTSLETGLDYEREIYSLCLTLEDKEEGINAFIEKREPQFKGR